jgi:hypothetical protein
LDKHNLLGYNDLMTRFEKNWYTMQIIQMNNFQPQQRQARRVQWNIDCMDRILMMCEGSDSPITGTMCVKCVCVCVCVCVCIYNYRCFGLEKPGCYSWYQSTWSGSWGSLIIVLLWWISGWYAPDKGHKLSRPP